MVMVIVIVERQAWWWRTTAGTERLGQEQADQLTLGFDQPHAERGALGDLTDRVGEGIAALAKERQWALRRGAADPGQHQRLPLERAERPELLDDPGVWVDQKGAECQRPVGAQQQRPLQLERLQAP